jgi:hypothetical protein
VTILGGIGFLTAGFMVGAFMFEPGLGLAYTSNALPYYIVLGTALFGLLLYLVMRRIKARKGIKVKYAFVEIPPE